MSFKGDGIVIYGVCVEVFYDFGGRFNFIQ